MVRLIVGNYDQLIDESDCFNSKMVRLIGTGRKAEEACRVRFNSKMVRLIDRSHYFGWCRQVRFNSKMVRLIERLWTASALRKRFQFQNGSINSLGGGGYCLPVVRFNSKMVRLIGERDRPRANVVLFQFQNGSINRRATPSHCPRVSVSIPKWFD